MCNAENKSEGQTSLFYLPPLEPKQRRHKWKFNKCIYCGLIRETIQQGIYYKTIYYYNGKEPILKRPECVNNATK